MLRTKMLMLKPGDITVNDRAVEFECVNVVCRGSTEGNDQPQLLQIDLLGLTIFRSGDDEPGIATDIIDYLFDAGAEITIIIALNDQHRFGCRGQHW